jgi:hypothetical protein
MNLLNDKKLFPGGRAKEPDPVRHKQLIIERTFDYGTWNDLKELRQHYSLEEVKFALQWARWLDDKTIHFVSAYFDIPLEKMRSYRQRQEYPKLLMI